MLVHLSFLHPMEYAAAVCLLSQQAGIETKWPNVRQPLQHHTRAQGL